MEKVITHLRENKKSITISKLIILSILTVLSFRWTFFINVMLGISILFALTEFDFDGFYILFFLVSFRGVFRYNLEGSIPYVSVVFVVYSLFVLIKYFIIKKEKLNLNWWIIVVSIVYLI